MPPLPKHPSLRRGHRSHAARAILYPVESPVVPELPDYCDWHPAVLDWWTDAWSSPMVPEWTESDRHTLVMAARLMQLVWGDDVASTPRTTAATEVRLLLRECGLTPMSRRTLQWEVSRAEAAVERTERRRAAQWDPRLRGGPVG
ncbi:phage terminase small subunit [Nocardia sp. NPDC003726]